MDKIYDNGALMIGNIDNVIKEIEKEIKENVGMIFIDQEELLKELKEIKNDGAEIVYINYENTMGYELNYWYKEDIVKENK